MAIDPITLGLISSGLSAAYKGYQGYKQQKDAKRAMRGLQEPSIEVPAALRQRAQEPISEQIMTAQAEEQARRTGQSVGALQKAGARGIIGGLGNVLDAERASERARMANYEQERRGALGQLGAAELDVQNREMQNYLQKMGAAQRGLEAGQQNIAGVLDTVSNVGQQLISAELMGMIPKGTPETPYINNPLEATNLKSAESVAGLGGRQITRPAAETLNIPSTLPSESDIPMEQGEELPLNVPRTAPPVAEETIEQGEEILEPPVSARPRGLKRTPMEAPNMGGIRTAQMPAEQAEDFMDAYRVGTGNFPSKYEPIQAPSARRLRRLAMQSPNSSLRLGAPSQYARALEILKRI